MPVAAPTVATRPDPKRIAANYDVPRSRLNRKRRRPESKSNQRGSLENRRSNGQPVRARRGEAGIASTEGRVWGSTKGGVEGWSSFPSNW